VVQCTDLSDAGPLDLSDLLDPLDL